MKRAERFRSGAYGDLEIMRWNVCSMVQPFLIFDFVITSFHLGPHLLEMGLRTFQVEFSTNKLIISLRGFF